jgi:hypothetical protein
MMCRALTYKYGLDYACRPCIICTTWISPLSRFVRNTSLLSVTGTRPTMSAICLQYLFRVFVIHVGGSWLFNQLQRPSGVGHTCQDVSLVVFQLKYLGQYAHVLFIYFWGQSGNFWLNVWTRFFYLFLRAEWKFLTQCLDTFYLFIFEGRVEISRLNVWGLIRFCFEFDSHILS